MNGKKPTREERKTLVKHGLDTYVWLVQKNTKEWLQVINPKTGEERKIEK